MNLNRCTKAQLLRLLELAYDRIYRLEADLGMPPKPNEDMVETLAKSYSEIRK